MKTPNTALRPRCTPAPPQGFALVVTLTMLILLTVIAVGLLSLSSISLRSSSQADSMSMAQANARLALMVAISELQREMGPDQRISARAEILDTNPDTPQVEGVTHPHYLGVWDSWDTWLTDNRGSLSIRDTYQRGRNPSMFRRWLASHPDAANFDLARNGGSGVELVTIVGEGTAGIDEANHVSVARVGIIKNNELKGNYAWWISDESLKARIDLNERGSSGNTSEAQLAAAHTGRMGVESMVGMNALDTAPKSLRKLITTRQAGISAGRDAVAERFHDMTSHSVGLFTDVRFGGLKSDLNLAFESDVVPEQMRETTLFGNAFDAPIRPMTGSLASVNPQNPFIGPMSWRQMREFYRVYRNGFADSGMRQPLQWSSGEPQTRRFLAGKNAVYQWDTMGYARQPVMLRQTWVIAATSQADPSLPGGVDYYILAIPVITLWNPYNVKLVMDSAEMSFLGSLLGAVNQRIRTYRGNQLLRQTDFPDNENSTWGVNANQSNPRRMYWVDTPAGKRKPNHDITANQLGFRMNIIENSTGSQPVVFEPGEVRIFSTDEEITTGVSVGTTPGRLFYATPGYTPVENTNAASLRGLRYRVYPFEGDPPSDPSTITDPLMFSLGLRESLTLASSTSSANQFRSSVTSGVVWSFQNTFGMSGNNDVNRGYTIDEGGNNVDRSWIETHLGANHFWDMAWFGATSVNWVEPDQIPQMGWVVGDRPLERAEWPLPGEPPMPVGMFSVVAKSAERFEYDQLPTAQTDFAGRDFRNRTWLHAPPTRISNFVMNPTNLERATSSYQMHFRSVNGDQEISQYLEAIGRKAFFGGGYTSGSGQTHVTALSLPTTPMVNLASFAGIRMDHGRTRDDVPQNGPPHSRIKVTSHAGGAFGVGIGNGYAHPMISPTGVYTRVGLGSDNNGTNLNLLDDYWDHLFLANEELWDSWFCSGIAPMVSNGVVTRSQREVATDFFGKSDIGNGPVSPHFRPHLGASTAGAIADTVDQPAELPWEKIAAHILHEGQFNVNSTSKEAWRAVLMSLADRPLAVFNGGSAPSVFTGSSDEATLSRHTMVGSTGQGNGPGSDESWRGIRTLTAAEIDKLAEEIVRQVKLRGPFLNMSEFVNRRLSDDELGMTGALQAAIDWDEFNAGYNGSTSGSGPSINAAYKNPAAMITASNVATNYPNSRAAYGSRYAGIQGYVMQSDILQGISTSLSVRGDTFTVRAYGESLARDGSVAAEAWCEAVVQRVPEYVDATDDAAERVRDPSLTTSDLSILKQVNREFGRKFQIVSFRWLSAQEV